MFYDHMAEPPVIAVPADAIAGVLEVAGWLRRGNEAARRTFRPGRAAPINPPSRLTASAPTNNVCTFAGHGEGFPTGATAATSAPRSWRGRLRRSARWSAHRQPEAPTARTAPRLHSSKQLRTRREIIESYISRQALIGADTSVVHLAGSLGCPGWVALAAVPDWRWLIERDDSPWYPTMGLFRQTRPRD